MLAFYRWLAETYAGLGVGVKILFILVIAVLTTVLGMWVVVSLPADHFTRGPSPDSWWRRHPVVRWTVLVLKNVLGLIVLPLGLVMVLPLVPGPGLVFILIGVSLLDFPGKRRLEKRLLGRPSVLRFLNDLRARYRRPPLQVHPE